MKCLNIKDKEVAALLDEYTNILGNYDAAYYVLSENNGYGLDKAPNGEPSKLYNDLLANYNNDHSMAIRAKSMVYSDSFKNWFGDWTNPLKPYNRRTSKQATVRLNKVSGEKFNVNPETMKGVILTDTNGHSIFNAMGRTFILCNVNGNVIPFYQSSRGTSGKIKGAWYPFFGYTGNWLIKGDVDEKGNMSYSSEIDRVTELLNKDFKIPTDFNNAGVSTSTGINVQDLGLTMYSVFDRFGKDMNALDTNNPDDLVFYDKDLKELTNANALFVKEITGIKTEGIHQSHASRSFIKPFIDATNTDNVSKVVDENGEPFIVYTGTLKDFDTFDSKYSRTASKGFFFTVDKEVAKSYGNVKEVFLNIKNLKEENKELSSLDLENGKYDGVSYFHDGAEAFVVWNPNQIKSINNQGTFSTESNIIYEQRITTKEQRLLNFYNRYVKLRSKSAQPAEDIKEHRKRISKLSSRSKLHRTDVSQIIREFLGINSDKLSISAYSDSEWYNDLDNLSKEDYSTSLNKEIEQLKSKDIPISSLDAAIQNVIEGYAKASDYDGIISELLNNMPKYEEATELPKNSRAKNLNQYNAYKKLQYQKKLDEFKSSARRVIYSIRARIYHLETIKSFIEEYEPGFNEMKLKVIDEYIYRNDYDSIKEPRLKKVYNALASLAEEQNKVDSQAAGEQVSEIKKIKTLKEAIDLLSEKMPQYSKILNYLKNIKFYEDVAITVADNLGNNTYSKVVGKNKFKINPETGEFSDTIIIGNNSYGYRTLLHEIIHTFTSLGLVAQDVNGSKKFEKDINVIMEHCYKYIGNQKLFGMLFQDNLNYGFTDPSEFVAEFFSNPAFQMLLKEIPAISETEVKEKNLFQSIIEAITRFFTNLIGNKESNLYDQIEPLMYNVIDFQTELYEQGVIRYNPNYKGDTTQINNQEIVNFENNQEVIDKTYLAFTTDDNIYRSVSSTNKSISKGRIFNSNDVNDVTTYNQLISAFYGDLTYYDSRINSRGTAEWLKKLKKFKSKNYNGTFLFKNKKDFDYAREILIKKLGSDKFFNDYNGEIVRDANNSYKIYLYKPVLGSSNSSINDDYINYLDSKEFRDSIIPPFEDYATIFNSPVSDVTEEATGSDKTLVSRLFDNKSKTTAREILAKIKNKSNLSSMVEILEKLGDTFLDTPIYYQSVGSVETGAAAVFSHLYKGIVVYGDANFRGKDGSADITILHELIHAATIQKIKDNPDVAESAGRLLELVRRKLEEKYGVSWEELKRSDEAKYYGLTDVYEFFAELYSNSRFIEELSTLEAEGDVKSVNILKGIVNWLLNLFAKFSNVKLNKTLYEQAAGELENIMFNTNEYLDNYNNQYSNYSSDELISASITATNDANKIKKILRDNASNISFDSDSHTYTNINTGELYTPVSTVKDLNGYGADIESMSEETLEYGKFAAEVGTAIHAEIHKLLTGEDIPESNVKLSKKAKKMIKDLVLPKIMKKGDTLVASESIIANDSAKVAGTVDMIKTDEDGNVHLLDFKTKARTAFGKKKYGFDYYFSAKKETKKGGKPDSERHDYQLTMYKRMLELAGVRVDSKEVVPIEYTVDENGVITEVWVPELDYAENGLIHHRVNNALENEINKSVFSGESSNNEINNENLVKQSEIVQNILKTLKNQLAIYRVKGYTTKSEILSSFINKLNSKEEDEVIVSYINQAVTLLKPLVDTYNNALADERNGKDNVWNLKMLESWKNYAESFYNLDDIQNYLFINPNALSNLDKESYRKVREALATAISYKNVLENSYKAKGEKLWLDWLTPFSSRIEAEYRRTAEREYKKNNKGTDKINDKNAMNRYIDAYIADHRNEINLKSREMLRQQSRIATSSPLSAIGRWLDNIFESSDPIVGSMARAYHTTWMQSNEEFNNKYRELVDLTSELEKAFPQFKDDPKKLYDFMIEFNNDSYNLISSLPVSFLNAYNNAKNEIKNNPEYETARDRSIAIAAWLEQNAPIKNKKELNSKKKDIISELLDTGIISKKEYDTLIRNENRDQSLKKSWSRLVETGKLSEAAADILRERFSKLNWEYRVPNSAKYPNTKWNELQKIRKNNPNDIRVRFYDFISELAKYGDSYVPDRFKLNGRLPGMSKTARERLKSGDVASQLISDIKNDLYLRADDTDKGMQMTDELDRPIKFVPIYFTNKLSIDEQSLDIATIYKEWFKSVNNYKYINSILPQLEYTKWVVNSRKTIKTDNAGNPVKNVLSKIMNNGDSDIDPTTNALITDENLISQLNAWFDQVVYGETSQNLGTFLGMDVAKLINVFQKYTSLKIMGLNFVSMVNNALVAELQQAEEAMAGQYISAESYARATSHYISDLPNILADVGARKKTSLTNLLNERFGVFTDFSEGSMLENTRFKKLCNTSTLYFTTNLGEHEAQSRFLKGCLIEKRALDKNGNDIGSMFDFFSAENGKLVFDKEHRVANFSNSEQIAFGQKVTAILRKQHGNYATYSRPELEQTGYGKLLLNFRKWIYPTFKRRFSKEYYDEYGQTFSKGFYIDGSQFYYNKVMSFFERMSDEAKALEYAEKADWDTMTDDEKANVKRFTTEISVLFASLAMQTLISAALDGYDDKDDFGYMVLSHLDYQIYRLSTDISFYSNPASFLKIVQSPIPSSSVIKSWSNFLDSMLHPTEKFEKGDWKGEYKIKKRVMDLLPIVRQIYRLRNIDDEKQLLSIV